MAGREASVESSVAAASPAAVQPSELPPLPESIRQLSGEFGDIKSLIGRLLESNDALAAALAEARRQASAGMRERERLIAIVERHEREATAAEQMCIELEQACAQREALAAKLNESNEALAQSEQGVRDLEASLQQCMAKCAGESEKAAAFQSQFERAVRVIEELRREIAASRKREREREACIQELTLNLDEVAAQRDVLKAELLQARDAMESIHQSILSVGVDFQAGWR
jgi:chromosome segregation ATPase